jgi:hypothetical protein
MGGFIDSARRFSFKCINNSWNIKCYNLISYFKVPTNKTSSVHVMEGRSIECLRTGCWGEYFEIKERKKRMM